MGIAWGYGIISYKKVNILKPTKGQLAKRFPRWRERRTSLRLVESRILYVGIRESMQNVSRSGEKGGPFALANGGK